MALAPKRATPKLPPEVNRILYVRNLPYKIATEELYQIFGKYGAVHQIRIGNTNETRGTGYVVYEDIFEAKNACENLSGFSVGNRYLIVQYYQAHKMFERIDNEKKERELEMLKKRYGLNSKD